MKPWLNTTEDRFRLLRWRDLRQASMKPWLNTTEDLAVRHHDHVTSVASMKPWLNTTEDDFGWLRDCCLFRRFNEAVAQHHGGRCVTIFGSWTSRASMKPWLNTTEDRKSARDKRAKDAALQ